MDRLELIREKIRRVAQDPDVDDKKGTQPKKYYSGVKKDKKDARDAHFKRGASMSDDNPAAYKPAPGDKDPKTGKLKKTKPSKHTKKFKAMYGETVNEVFIPYSQPWNDKKGLHQTLGLLRDTKSRKNAAKAIEKLAKKHKVEFEVDGRGQKQFVYLTSFDGKAIDKLKKDLMKNKKLVKALDTVNGTFKEEIEINEVTFGNPNATEADALPPKVVNRFVKEYKNADKLQTLVIRTKSKIRGSEQRETLDDLNKKVRDFKFALSDCIETGSTIVMDYTPDGDDLYEGKLVTGVDSVLSVITKKLKAEMGKRYKKNAESGMKYINNIAKMVGMTASDKGQQKNRMFLRMSEETLDEKAPNTADAMKRYKSGKAGFTDKAHLKAKGLIPRSDGTKRKSPKYEAKTDMTAISSWKKKLKNVKGLSKDVVQQLSQLPTPVVTSLINQIGMIVAQKEELGKNADAGDYIDDFRKSDAPQFKGKSDAKIRKMAIAAYLDAKDKK